MSESRTEGMAAAQAEMIRLDELLLQIEAEEASATQNLEALENQGGEAAAAERDVERVTRPGVTRE